MILFIYFYFLKWNHCTLFRPYLLKEELSEKLYCYTTHRNSQSNKQLFWWQAVLTQVSNVPLFYFNGMAPSCSTIFYLVNSIHPSAISMILWNLDHVHSSLFHRLNSLKHKDHGDPFFWHSFLALVFSEVSNKNISALSIKVWVFMILKFIIISLKSLKQVIF